jgi:hypothetical protein
MSYENEIYYVREDYENLSLLSSEMRNNKEIVLAAVTAHRDAFQFASKELKQDFDVVMAYLTKNGPIEGFEYYDKEFILQIAAEASFALKYAPAHWRNIKEIVLEIVQVNGLNIQDIGEDLVDDEEIAHAAIFQNPGAFEFVKDEIKMNNKEMIVAGITKDNVEVIFEKMNESFKSDKEFMFQCAKKTSKVVSFVEDKLKLEFVPFLIKNGDSESLKYLPKELLTKEIVMEAVLQNGKLLEFAGEFNQDKDIVLAALQQTGKAIEFVSESLRNEKEIALIALKNDWSCIGDKIIQDKDFAIEALKIDCYFFEELSEDLRNDQDVIAAGINIVFENVKDSTEIWYYNKFVNALKFRENKELCLELINLNPLSIMFFCDDKELAFAAIKKDPSMFLHAGYYLKGDKDFVRECIKLGASLCFVGYDLSQDIEFNAEMVDINFNQIAYANSEVQNDKEIMLKVIRKNGSLAMYASYDLQSDREFMLEAFKHGATEDVFSDEFRNDKEFISELLKINGLMLRYANYDFRMDKDLCMTAISQNNRSICYTSEFLQDEEIQQMKIKFGQDKDLMLTWLKEDASAMSFASEDLRNDREFVLFAVQQNCSSNFPLEFASKDLRNDKEIVLASVQKYPLSFEFASEELRNDKDIALTVIKLNHYAFSDAGDKIRQDPDIIEALNKI